MPADTGIVSQPSLRRELGKWDLTAIGVNQVIGGAIFAMPATIAASSGAWSPWLVLAIGVASMLIALTFAEIGSRFETTGGSYIYTRVAFGRFIAFEVGWMQWFTRVASWASVINVLVAYVGFYWPAATEGLPRAGLMGIIIAVLAIINVLGIKQSAVVLNGLTIGKLAPLALFIVVGSFAIHSEWLRPQGSLSLAQVSSTGLLLIYAYGGYEVIPVPAGEARDPRRGVPFALIMTILIVTAVFWLAQIVCLGTLPGLTTSRTPLADASVLFMGAAGAAVITIGAMLSTLGNNMGQALSGSRNLFALAEQGDVPACFARIHPRFRTPVNAIATTALVSFVLAVSGTFVTMASASAISRLVIYLGTCAAALRLRSRTFDGRVGAATFRVPFGPVIPSASILIALAILAGATPLQLISGLVTLGVGAALFLIAIATTSSREPV